MVPHALKQLLQAAELDEHSPPTAEAWASFLVAVGDQLAARSSGMQPTVGSLQSDIEALRRQVSLHHEDLGEILEGVTGTLTVFQDAIQGDRAAQKQALDLAQQRFSLKLSATWSDVSEVADDTAAGEETALGIKVLQEGLRRLGQALGDLVEMATEVSATQQQLDLAGTVQMMLVPPSQLTLPNIELWSWFEPATQCGGDWWTAAALGKGASLIVIGDVTGHGAPAAIIAGTAKGACDLARMGMRENLQAHQLMRMLNRVIIESAAGQYMMTGLAIKVVERTMWISNAGHPSPYLVRGDEVTPIGPNGAPPLGAEQVVSYSEVQLELQAGDIVIAYTDGITETESEDGRELGERALRAVVVEHAASGPEQMVQEIRRATLHFRGKRPQNDDISLVVIQVN
jgi:serine phosphatase RsbU (regulator of sigma subunit)